VKFFDYLDITFQLESKQNTLEGFSLFRDGKLKAVHALIGVMRFTYKWANVPLLFLDYLAVQLRLHPAPMAPIPLPPPTPQMEAPKEENKLKVSAVN
jgi:hypothetical protein